MLRDAVDNIPNGFAIYGEDQRLILCNAAYAALYDRTPDEMIGSTSGENYLRAPPKLKIFDAHEDDSDAATDASLSDDRPWLQTVAASERAQVAFQPEDGRWMQTTSHPRHAGGHRYL